VGAMLQNIVGAPVAPVARISISPSPSPSPTPPALPLPSPTPPPPHRSPSIDDSGDESDDPLQLHQLPNIQPQKQKQRPFGGVPPPVSPVAGQRYPNQKNQRVPNYNASISEELARLQDRREHANLAKVDWSSQKIPLLDRLALIEHFDAYATSTTADFDAPTHAQAMAGAFSKEWIAAETAEYDMLVERGTGTLVPRVKGAKVIGGRWVLTTKRDENGIVIKRKARWVALGYLQQHGFDYDDTFASVARTDTVRTLLAEAATYDLEIASWDVKGAFLAGEIDIEGILVEPPKGFNVAGKEGWV